MQPAVRCSILPRNCETNGEVAQPLATGPSFGGELLAALGGGGARGDGLAAAGAAARVLSHVLSDSANTRAQALAAQAPASQQNPNGGAAARPLLAAVCSQLAAAAAAADSAAAGPAAAALQGLLVAWCHDFAPAAGALLEAREHLALLTDLAAGRCVFLPAGSHVVVFLSKGDQHTPEASDLYTFENEARILPCAVV